MAKKTLADLPRPERQARPGPRRFQRAAGQETGDITNDRRIRAALPTVQAAARRAGPPSSS